MSAKSIDYRPLAVAALLLALSGPLAREAGRAQAGLITLPAAIAQKPPKELSRFSLISALSGMRSVGADWAYIDALQYVGTVANREDGRYRRTYQLYREVLWCDPYFHFAVLEGASMLGWNLERIAEAMDLLEAAMAADPVFARYRLYYAALAYQKEDADPNRVLDVLREEVKRPDAPEMLLRMVGNIYMKYQDWESAVIYWNWVLSRAKERETLARGRENLAEALAKYKAGGGK